MKFSTKRPFTLLEIMIVVFMIGLIVSAIGYNMRGSLDQGRAFKSEQASRQIYDILTLRIAQGETLDSVLERPEEIVIESGLIKNPKKLMKDGWNQQFDLHKVGRDDFVVYSSGWYSFLKKQKKLEDREMQEDYPWAFNFTDELDNNVEELEEI